MKVLNLTENNLLKEYLKTQYNIQEKIKDIFLKLF